MQQHIHFQEILFGENHLALFQKQSQKNGGRSQGTLCRERARGKEKSLLDQSKGPSSQVRVASVQVEREVLENYNQFSHKGWAQTCPQPNIQYQNHFEL